MSKSPLSGAFADSSATTKKKNKKNGAILLISGIALATSIGGVFAANSITINSGEAIEFGQGVAATSSCDTDGITTAISQELPSGTTTEFVVRDVELSNISSDCNGIDLVVSLLDNNNGELTKTTLRTTSGATTATWDVSAEDESAGDVSRVSITTGD
jgi:hypothetical protein